MNKLLTILLPLKDRHAFTVRYLRYLSEINFKHTVFIADGSLTDESTHIVHRPEFNKLRINYKRYAPDISYNVYYKKLVDAFSLIDSTYVMLNDNDDYPIPSGIDKALEALKNNPNLISAGGLVGGIQLKRNYSEKDKSIGKVYDIWAPYHKNKYQLIHDYSSYDIEKNLPLQARKRSYYLYYNIAKSSIYKTIFSEFLELNPKDIHLTELFFYSRLLSLGIVKNTQNYIHYIRQTDSSSIGSTIAPWEQRVLKENWIIEFKKYTSFLREKLLSQGMKKSPINNMIGILEQEHFRFFISDLVAKNPVSHDNYFDLILRAFKKLFSRNIFYLEHVTKSSGCNMDLKKLVDFQNSFT